MISDAPQPPPVDRSEPYSLTALDNSEFLTDEEIIKRRHRRVRQLARVYRDHYWTLVAELRSKYREYLWKYGDNPFVSDLEGLTNGSEGHGQHHRRQQQHVRCGHSGCKQKAMPMTTFCHTHILSDPNQVLYKACAHVTSKSGSRAQTVCRKPILRSVTPSFCTYHLQRAEKAVARALKTAGLSNNDSSKMAPLIHIIGAEFTQHILKKRRDVRDAKVNSNKMEEDSK